MKLSLSVRDHRAIPLNQMFCWLLVHQLSILFYILLYSDQNETAMRTTEAQLHTVTVCAKQNTDTLIQKLSLKSML